MAFVRGSLSLRQCLPRQRPVVAAAHGSWRRFGANRRRDAASPPKVLVLGGSGVFGRRLARHLLAAEAGATPAENALPEIEVVLAGRNLQTLKETSREIWEGSGRRLLAPPSVVTTDVTDPARLGNTIGSVDPAVVVHAAGPFQAPRTGEGIDRYSVARACVQHGCHYVDMSDDRTFVEGFADSLDDSARAARVTLVSGASTTPGVTSAVVEHFHKRWPQGQLTGAQTYISPGNRLPRGAATIAAVISYCGQPFQVIRDGEWGTVYGWQGLRTKSFHGLGERLVARCNVADLSLLPGQHPSLKTMELRAGLEIRAFVLGLFLMSWLGRLGPLSERGNMRLADVILPVSNLFSGLGSNDGGMVMTLTGLDREASPVSMEWSVTVEGGDGPNLPCMSAAAMTRKLATASFGSVSSGARPCLGDVSLEEFQHEMNRYRVFYREDCVTGDEVTTPAHRGLLTQALGSQGVQVVPTMMRAFHERAGQVVGTFTITRGDQWYTALMGKLAGFPAPGENLPTTVHAEPLGEGEGSSWIRSFGRDQMVSTLRYRGGLVEETFSILGFLPVTFGFHFVFQPLRPGFLKRPHLEGLHGKCGLHHITRKMWIGPSWFRILVPKALMITADGVSLPTDNGCGWSVDVSVQAPFGLGQLLSYSGDVTAVEDSV